MQEVMAAMTTSPSPMSNFSPSTATRGGVRRAAEDLGQGGFERRGGGGQFDLVLRTLRAGQRRHDGRDVQFQHVGEDRVFRGLVDPQALSLGIGLDQGDARLVAARGGQIGDGRRPRRGRSRRWRRIPGPCWRWSPGPRWSCSAGPAPKNSTNLPTTPFLRSIWVTVSTRSVAVVPSGMAPVRLEADDFRDQHRDRLAQHGRLGLDAADAPAQDGQAVDHGGVAVGADDGVGIGDGRLAFGQGPDGLGQVLEVDLVADAGAGGHDAEVVEGRRAPAQEFVALDVALVLALDVLAEGFRRCRNCRP